ncbi:MAG TPA: S53 family peptidase [Longimicrobium sp.]|nr:S53 family peptidase [Longimicrobium sp.]
MSTSHVMLPGSERPAKRGATRVRDVDPETPVEVTLTLRGPALPDADHLPARTLSPAELASAYGASEHDAATVSDVLARHGLTVRTVDLPARSVVATGPARAMESAFHAGLGVYHHAGQGEYRGREGAVHVPAPLDGIVTGVFGLDQRRVARRHTTGAPAAPAVAMAGPPAPLGPAEVEAHYGFPPGDGAGQAIAIAEFGGAYQPADLASYASRYGRPVPAIHVVQVNAPPPDPGDTDEVMMDVEIVAGLCPGAHISVLFASFDQKGWVDLLNRAIHDRPVVLSVSWGSAEDDADAWSAAARTAVNERLQAAAMLGITVCASSGDDGSGDQVDDGRAHVNFPASSPFVLGVGGTMLVGTPTSVSEQAWFQAPGTRAGGGGATGGGVSACFARPAWQGVHVASVNPGAIDGRVVPDVAAMAGYPWYSVTVNGQVGANGGTSAATPVWAALIARVNAALPRPRRQRFLTPLLYQAGAGGSARGAAACQDITRGQNASHPMPGVGYSATPGYDAVSGWGTPVGTRLLSALQS